MMDAAMEVAVMDAAMEGAVMDAAMEWRYRGDKAYASCHADTLCPYTDNTDK